MTAPTAPRLLYVQSSLKPDSVSRRVADAFVQTWQQRHPGAPVDTLDLNTTAMPHFAFPGWLSSHSPLASQSDEVKAAGAFVDRLVSQLEAASTLLIACPMYNFTLPSTLKAWFDHVICTGRTFVYTPTGPQGQLGGRKVVVVESRGGDYTLPMLQPMDHQEPILRQMLGFLGLTDVQFVHAQGMAMPQADVPALIDAAQQRARALAEAM